MKKNSNIPVIFFQINSNQKINWKKTAEKIYEEYVKLQEDQFKYSQLSDKLRELKTRFNTTVENTNIGIVYDDIIKFFPILIRHTSLFELPRQENLLKDWWKYTNFENIKTIEEKKEFIIRFIERFIDVIEYDIPDWKNVFDYTYTNFFNTIKC